MNKEEYQDFVLRYKGCGACFPMYHTLSRFEKMWFTAIQKDVAKLEKENAELKSWKCKAETYMNYLIGIAQGSGLEKDNLVLEAEQFLNSEVEK